MATELVPDSEVIRNMVPTAVAESVLSAPLSSRWIYNQCIIAVSDLSCTEVLSFSKQLHVSLSPRFGVFLEQVKGSRPDELPHDVVQTIEQSAHVTQRNDCCGVNCGLLVL